MSAECVYVGEWSLGGRRMGVLGNQMNRCKEIVLNLVWVSPVPLVRGSSVLVPLSWYPQSSYPHLVTLDLEPPFWLPLLD